MFVYLFIQKKNTTDTKIPTTGQVATSIQHKRYIHVDKTVSISTY